MARRRREPEHPPPPEMARPALWPEPRAYQQPHAYEGTADPEAPPPSPRRMRVAWGAVALMVLGLVLAGVGVAAQVWLLVAAGVVVGAVGALLAWRGGIMDDATTT